MLDGWHGWLMSQSADVLLLLPSHVMNEPLRGDHITETQEETTAFL
jgi:hypothetical protein